MTHDQLEILAKVISNLLNMKTIKEFEKFNDDINNMMSILAHDYVKDRDENDRNNYLFYDAIAGILVKTSFYSAES